MCDNFVCVLNSNLFPTETFIDGEFVSSSQLKFDLSSINGYKNLNFFENAYCYVYKLRCSGGNNGITFSYNQDTGILLANSDSLTFYSGAFGSYNGIPVVCIIH